MLRLTLGSMLPILHQKIKLIIIIACLAMTGLFSFQSANAKQSGLLDSLKSLELSEFPDSIQLEVVNLLAGKSTNPDSILFYGQKLLKMAKNEDPIWKFRGYLSIGNAQRKFGEFDKALKNYFNALRIAKVLSYHYEAMINTTIADTYKSSENLSKAYEYYQAAEKLYHYKDLQIKRDSIYITAVYTNLGDLFLLQNNYDSALNYFNRAEQFAKLLNLGYYLAVIRGNIALVYANKGENENAETEIFRVIEYLEQNNRLDNAIEFLTYMIDIYKERNDIENALKYAKKSFSIAKKWGLKKQAQDISLILYELMLLQKKYKQALYFHEQYAAYRDSTINRETIQKMADQRTEFEVGQKQAELDLVTAEKRTQQIILYATAGGALLVMALLGLVYKNYRDKNKINLILEDQKAQLEELNHTKDKFFSIVSHDLRGPVVALSGISRLIQYSIEDDDKEGLIEVSEHIDKTVNHLSGLLDNLLNWAMQQQGHFPNVPEKLSLKEITTEIVGIFENMADGKNIALTSSIEGDIHLWSDKNMTMTILRNLVNNALKFTDQKGEVTITAKRDGDMAAISVKDTGVGIPEEKLNRLFKMDGKITEFGTAGEKGLGLGLQLVYEFVESNNGSIEVKSEVGKGTEFIVKLPLFEPEKVEMK